MDIDEFLNENTLYKPGCQRFYEMLYPAKEDIDYVKTFLPDRRGPILELGCGLGRVVSALAKSFPNTVFLGLDVLDHYIEIASHKARQDPVLSEALRSERLRFIKGNMLCLSEYFASSEKFDVIILCNSTLLHCKTQNNIKLLFESVKNQLSPEGVFFLEYATTFDRNWEWEEDRNTKDPEYRLFRRNAFDRDTNAAKRFFRFQKRDNPEEMVELHVTAHPVDQGELLNLLRSSNLTITREEQNFPGEQKGRRRILFLEKKVHR